ncbi:hypothetical protein [Hyphomicrobium sp. MC1]|uniref:hypothetical protein n=1 Tax=Hyphomicrobium sp. (strain MC1) TaxID=717785 RepID=UPI00059B69FD|nr:hypothetical protein [Hyphomicrobium sp. MC1]
MSETEIFKKLSGGAIDTLRALARGPKFDGDVPSKAGRNELVELGLARRDRQFPDGPYKGCQMNELTEDGKRVALRNPQPQSYARH